AFLAPRCTRSHYLWGRGCSVVAVGRQTPSSLIYRSRAGVTPPTCHLAWISSLGLVQQCVSFTVIYSRLRSLTPAYTTAGLHLVGLLNIEQPIGGHYSTGMARRDVVRRHATSPPLEKSQLNQSPKRLPCSHDVLTPQMPVRGLIQATTT